MFLFTDKKSHFAYTTHYGAAHVVYNVYDNSNDNIQMIFFVILVVSEKIKYIIRTFVYLKKKDIYV